MARSSLAHQDDQVTTFWDVGTGKNLLQLQHGASTVAFTPDNKTFFFTKGGNSWSSKFDLYDLATGKILGTFDSFRSAPTRPLKCMAMTRDGKTLALAGYPKVILWDVASRNSLHLLSGHKEQPDFLAFSHDGKSLASASVDGVVKLWRVDTGKEVNTILVGRPFGNSGINSGPRLAISRDFKTLAWNVEKGKITLRNIASGKDLNASHGDWTIGLAFSPDGKWLATGADEEKMMTIKVWEVASGKNLGTLKTGQKGNDSPFPVSALAWSPEGRVLASGGGYEDASIKLWEIIPAK